MSIKGYIDQQDTRNAAADQLHVEHGARLAAAEAILQQSQPVAMNDFEIRMRSWERFKYTLLGAVVVVNALLGVIEDYATHH